VGGSATAAPTRTLTVRFRRTSWYRQAATVSGFRRDCFWARARSTSRGFRSTTSCARWSSARGRTTWAESICSWKATTPTAAAATSPASFPTENGTSSVYDALPFPLSINQSVTFYSALNNSHFQLKIHWTETERYSVDVGTSRWIMPMVISWKRNMGTLASQAEIRVWVQAPGPRTRRSPPLATRIRGYHPRKKFEIVYAQSYNLVHFGRKMVRNAVNKHFKIGNSGPTRSPSKWSLKRHCQAVNSRYLQRQPERLPTVDILKESSARWLVAAACATWHIRYTGEWSEILRRIAMENFVYCRLISNLVCGYKVLVNMEDYRKLTFSKVSQSLSCCWYDISNLGLDVCPFMPPCLRIWSSHENSIRFTG